MSDPQVDCAPRLVRRSSQSIRLDGILAVDIPGGYAFAIGPESHFDRCYLMPTQNLPPVTGGVSTSTSAYRALTDNMVEVSSKRPHVGYLEGPLCAMLPYAHSEGSFASLINRFCPGIVNGQGYPIFGQPAGQALYAQLDLQIYPFLPPWLPSSRAPLEHALVLNNFGASGGAGGTSGAWTGYMPVYGRKRYSLAIKGVWVTGDLSWTVTAMRVADVTPTDFSVDIQIEETLVPVTVELASFQRIYSCEDLAADFVKITVTEGSALDSTAKVKLIQIAEDG